VPERALRNLSVAEDNKAAIRELGGVALLAALARSGTDRVRMQAEKALVNMEAKAPAGVAPAAAADKPQPSSDGAPANAGAVITTTTTTAITATH
jgi:hypothetical protein